MIFHFINLWKHPWNKPTSFQDKRNELEIVKFLSRQKNRASFHKYLYLWKVTWHHKAHSCNSDMYFWSKCSFHSHTWSIKGCFNTYLWADLQILQITYPVRKGNLSSFFCLTIIIFLPSPNRTNIICRRYAYKVINLWLWVACSCSLITTHSFCLHTPMHILPDVLLCDAWQNECWSLLHYTLSAIVILSDEYTGNMTKWLGCFHPRLKQINICKCSKPFGLF